MLIRPARPGDLGIVLLFARANSLENHRAEPRIDPRSHTEAYYDAMIRHGLVLLAETDEPIGMLALRPEHARAHITDAFVVRRQRRKGVLRALVDEVYPWCRARGIEEIDVDWLATNPNSGAAWVALGFAPMSVTGRRSVPR